MRVTQGMRRRLIVLGATLALAAGGLIALAPSTSAGSPATVTLVKEVIGTAPAGTIFTLHFQCTGAFAPSGDRMFDATGTPIPPGSNTFSNDAPTCTVTETATGGADSTVFTCTLTSGAGTCSGGNSFSHGGPATATIKATNAYSNALGPLTVNPTSTTPGQQVTVSGSKCTKALVGGSSDTGGAVQVTVHFPTPIVLNTTAAGGSGAWSVQFTVPDGTSGPYSVTAICGDPVPYPSATLTVGTTAAPAAAAPATAVLAAPSQTG